MSLDDVRREIDRLDDQIVALLALRQQQVIRAAGYKTSAAEVAAPQRRAQMMRRLRAQASASGVDSEVVTQVYTAMIDAFIELEHREHRALAPANQPRSCATSPAISSNTEPGTT